MARVSFTGHLQRHLGCASVDAPGGTVAEVLDAAFIAYPKLRSYLLDDQGRLRKHVNLFVGDTAVRDRDRLKDSIAEHDELFVFQALSGG